MKKKAGAPLPDTYLSKTFKNDEPMPGVKKTVQFINENIGWKHALYFLIQENSALKTLLSEAVDKESDKLFIEVAEQFQNEFIVNDECLHDIGTDIKRQEKNLQEAFAQERGPDQRTDRMQEKLRNEIRHLETESARLKNQFNEYLRSVV